MAGTTRFATASAAVATAEFTGAVVLEADLELTASGTLDFNGSLSGDAGTESLTIVSVTDLTFAAAVQDIATLEVQTADTITFESTLDDITTLDLTATDTITFESTLDSITTVDLTATTTRFEGDLTGLGGLTVAGTTRFATASAAVATAEFTGAVVLEQTLVVAVDEDIVFHGQVQAVNADVDLAINAGQSVSLEGAVTGFANLDFEAGTLLMLPDSGLDVGLGTLRLVAVEDIVDQSGRELGILRAGELILSSGSSGGDTNLITDVTEIQAELSGEARGLTISEADSILLTRLFTKNGEIVVNGAQHSFGDIFIVEVNAGQQRVILDTTAQGGGIFDGDETLTDVVAESLAILASTGVGANSRLEVDVQQLAVETVSGSIRIEDIAGGLTITDVAGISGVQILAGDASHGKLTLRATGSVSVETVGNIDGGDITLARIMTDDALTISTKSSGIKGSREIFGWPVHTDIVVDSARCAGDQRGAGEFGGKVCCFLFGPQNGNTPRTLFWLLNESA
ncbi:MAG: hypothetical protein R3C12_19285 [Planctomycetaceae bacterium]